MKLHRSQILVFVLLLSVITTACSQNPKLAKKEITLVRVDGSSEKIVAELALTEKEREHGYMGRKTIPDGTGMLFVFYHDQVQNFWMKNTPHPLSIAYIDSSGKIRDILDMTPFSLANVTSTVSVRYALEVPQGWFDKVNIKVGDSLILDSIK